ncbi:MAG: DUF4390 domain-containing protein [Conchiformibius sp.]|nr:DUF4390 domain-containing protein [Conchiformibius sp.]
MIRARHTPFFRHLFDKVFRIQQYFKILFTLPVLFTVFAVPALSPSVASAQGISIIRGEGRILSDGRMAVSSRFDIHLPQQLEKALKDGVPLDFTLSYRLEKPTLASYRNKLSQLVGSGHTVHYRIAFHPLTEGYRVSVGTFSMEYDNLDTALKGVGAIADWQVLHRQALSGSRANEVHAQIRLNLATGKLPKPFQINALASDNWQLDSGWQTLAVSY